METYGPSTWGDRYADVYEDYVRSSDVETEPAVELLAEVASGGPALELGIGTGRIALPLAARGIDVHGIEASEAMVARLREQPGGDRIPVTIGDFAGVAVEGRFQLIYAVFNTFFELYTEEDQIRCLQNVAEHLTHDGLLVLELHVPVRSSSERGEHFRIESLEPDRVMVSFSRHDPLTNRIDSVELWITEEGIRFFPLRDRPVPPSELDLMARLAGLELRDRWGGWRREPFTAKSEQHVSVYARGGS